MEILIITGMLKQMNAEMMFIKATQQAILSELEKLTESNHEEIMQSIQSLTATYILDYEKTLNGIIDYAKNYHKPGKSIEDFLSENP